MTSNDLNSTITTEHTFFRLYSFFQVPKVKTETLNWASEDGTDENFIAEVTPTTYCCVVLKTHLYINADGL